VVEIEVIKATALVPASAEALSDGREAAAAFRRWMTATPEERTQWADDQKRLREADRATAEKMPLTLETLLDKLGFSREYAEHLMQPYCDCGDGSDGWDYCQHAYDLGFVGGAARRG